MNILLIGHLPEVQTLMQQVEGAAKQRCLQVELEPDLHERLQKNYWHLIILAVNYENLVPACEALHLLKAANPLSHVILVSENKDVNLPAALEAGQNHLLVQPLSAKTLLEKLNTEVELVRLSMDTKRILAIGAHPDDVEVGCGATLLKHTAKGDQVSVLTLTNGAQNLATEAGYQQSLTAAGYMNAELYMKDLKDALITDGPDTIKAIEEILALVKPDIIYTHSINDNQQDHRNVHYATLVAARGVSQMYAYLSPSSNTSFHPQHFEHVEQFLDDKLKLISCYHSEKTKCAYLSDSLIRSTAEYWGRFSRCGLVEPFEVIRS